MTEPGPAAHTFPSTPAPEARPGKAAPSHIKAFQSVLLVSVPHSGESSPASISPLVLSCSAPNEVQPLLLHWQQLFAPQKSKTLENALERWQSWLWALFESRGHWLLGELTSPCQVLFVRKAGRAKASTGTEKEKRRCWGLTSRQHSAHYSSGIKAVQWFFIC